MTETPILVVSPTAMAGGAERALAGLVRHLPSEGFRPVCALLEHGPAEAWLSDAQCEAIVVGTGGQRSTPEVVPALLSLAKAIRAGAVLSNKWQGHLYGGAVSVQSGLPATWWQADIARNHPDEERAARLPATVIACMSAFAATAQRQLSPHTKIVEIHPGIAVETVAEHRGSGRSVRAALGWGTEPVVGIVGRLEPWKGQETFLQAARLVAECRADTRFAIVGGALLGNEGSYPAKLYELAADLGIADRTYLAGHQQNVYPWFDALDVVVHASEGEPFGLVVVEGMALSKPVVATTPGGPAEIIEHERSGLLVPPNDAAAMADAILRILGDPGLARRLGGAAARRARRFSDRRTAEKFGAVLAAIVEAGRGRSHARP
jgi:glycosyltransferase involved in cell wall biosynthesis